MTCDFGYLGCIPTCIPQGGGSMCRCGAIHIKPSSLMFITICILTLSERIRSETMWLLRLRGAEVRKSCPKVHFRMWRGMKLKNGSDSHPTT